MRLIGSDPDIQTLVSRIDAGDIDLQPNFQRGEVWPRTKKQKLIDSVLRDWHVPPIHVIEVAGSRKQEVLDGQQRLVAIRDFASNQFPIDGSIEPNDPEISSLDGMYFRDLSEAWQRRFNQFTIRVFRVTDYKPSEPGELFFRLNQPTSLTGAEQRNAFFGPVREQIKALVGILLGTDAESNLGFKNSRMAYDDVLARVGLVIERRSISEKITAANLADFYRREDAMDHETTELIEYAIRLIASSFGAPFAQRYNKATLFSWIVFIVRDRLLGSNSTLNEKRFDDFLRYFDVLRFNQAWSASDDKTQSSQQDSDRSRMSSWMLYVFSDRSSARVADVSSVLLRDAILWNFYSEVPGIRESSITTDKVKPVTRILTLGFQNVDDDMCARRLLEEGWGELP
jgi:hypothetical protein